MEVIPTAKKRHYFIQASAFRIKFNLGEKA